MAPADFGPNSINFTTNCFLCNCKNFKSQQKIYFKTRKEHNYFKYFFKSIFIFNQSNEF